jgi:uncharacterized cupin superfamily protein
MSPRSRTSSTTSPHCGGQRRGNHGRRQRLHPHRRPHHRPRRRHPQRLHHRLGRRPHDSFTAAEWTAAAGSFTHTYADGPGSATITVSTTDEDGSFTLGTQEVTIANVAPTATVSGAATIAEGSLYTLTVGPITDPGADTRSSYTIAWGDGLTDSFTAAEWTAAAGSFTHTYADGPGNATSPSAPPTKTAASPSAPRP